MKLTKTLASAGVVASVLTLALAGNAFAGTDTNTGSNTTYVAVGSDTTDDVIAALSTALVDGSGNPLISSYSASDSSGVAGGLITTKSSSFSNPNCTFTRPNGSSSGINALTAALNGTAIAGQTTGNGTGCVQIARSSSGPTTANATSQLTYIPFAIDSVSYATTAVTRVPKNLGLAKLKEIYTANGTPGTSACGGALIKAAPLIPQAGSGTRRFWAKLLGITDAALSTTPGNGTTQWGTCVRDTISTGAAVQEHFGTSLETAGSIVPFSTAQWIAQGSGTITDNRGTRATLSAIDFDGTGANAVSPFVLQQDFKSATVAANNATREVYNVVDTQALAGGTRSDATLQALLQGPTSTLCSSATAKKIIQKYGFDLDTANCGSVALKN